METGRPAKTSIANDTILNPVKARMGLHYGHWAASIHCVACCPLLANDAMDYNCHGRLRPVMAPLQYEQHLLCWTAMAEYFMHQGKDVLIIYDDLAHKETFLYRALSLPLDARAVRLIQGMFYLHIHCVF